MVSSAVFTTSKPSEYLDRDKFTFNIIYLVNNRKKNNLETMEFDTNCYRALLISFSLIHFLTSTALVLLAAYLTFWNDYFKNGIVPDKYQATIYIIGFGALLSFIASEYRGVFQDHF